MSEMGSTQGRKAGEMISIKQAQTLYLNSLRAQYVQLSTLDKYRYHCQALADWMASQRLGLDQITKLHLQQFLAQRGISQNTANKEAQFYKAFFSFCEEAGLISVNPARKLKPPPFRPPDNRPYTQEEIIRILAACDQVGQHSYERLRAKAAVLILWKHALRISDVLKLRCDALQFDTRKGQWRLRLQTQKNKANLDHLVSQEVLEALRRLPVPIGTRTHEHFFWNGVGRFKNVMDSMTTILRDVYRLSGVQGAHNHRWRHTKVTGMLANRAPLPIVARFLGITDAICSKHYAKYSAELQDTIDQYAAVPAVPIVEQAQEYQVS